MGNALPDAAAEQDGDQMRLHILAHNLSRVIAILGARPLVSPARA